MCKDVLQVGHFAFSINYWHFVIDYGKNNSYLHKQHQAVMNQSLKKKSCIIITYSWKFLQLFEIV